MNLGHFFNGNNLVNDLSPVSTLRLNFDQLPSETTDPVTPTKNVFGVPVPQFVPERIISWLDNSQVDGGSINCNQSDGDSNSISSDKVIFSNNELNNPIARKVRHFFLSLSLSLNHFGVYPFFDAIRFKNINQFFRFQVDNVRMIDRYNVKNPTIGTLYITATHIIFVDPETNKETWVSLRSNFHYSLGWQLKCI